jgi:hypothetical protein
LDPENVLLLKFMENWIELPTEKIDEDEDYVYFSAEVTGHSLYAVTGVEAPPAVLPTVPAVYPTVPAPVGPPLYLVILAAIALVAVIVAIIWRYISVGAKGLPKVK